MEEGGHHFGSVGLLTRVRPISFEYFSTRINDLFESHLPKKHILLCIFLMVNDEQKHMLCTTLPVNWPSSSFLSVLFGHLHCFSVEPPHPPSSCVAVGLCLCIYPPLSLCDHVSLSCFLVLCVSPSVCLLLSFSFRLCPSPFLCEPNVGECLVTCT